MSTFLLPTSLEDEIQRMLNSFWWGSNHHTGRGIKWLSWDKLTMRKEYGGMSFRHLHGFNLAMLGKQGWNLQSNPDALFTRIFKARYFPQGDFLGARLGHNPSFIWRSIHASQVLVRQGARWYAQSILSIPLNLAQTASPVVNHRWTKPPADTFTCNVDAALFNDSSTFGFGICVRDTRGLFQTAISGWKHGLPPPHEAEAAAMLEAIQYLIHSPYDNVCVETDCKQVADHLNSTQVLHSEYGIIINQCRSLLRSHQNLQVRFIRRQDILSK
uniref:RNase H type-1 domain-containing protein n=1 Tax=Cajanus cajan TaxID=3821 RepID=A0A151RZB8_CAJCA|nr:hypothetical protein KK1_030479 [Cajanus cajan]